jgi:drug/metabolite transporter, DME family
MSVDAGESALLRHRVEILAAGVAFSLGGLFIRMIGSATPWQMLFYRSGFLALAIALYLLWRERGGLLRNLAAAGWAGVLGGLCIGVAMTGFILSVTHTTVANTLFVLAASPFVAAALGWLTIRERVRARTWGTMLVAGLGIGVMVYDGIALGHSFGLLVALAATFGFAGMTVVMRWRREVGLLSAGLYGSLFACAAGLLGSLDGGLAVPMSDLGLLFLYGGLVMVLGFIAYTHAGRFVPAAEVTLLSLSEVALGPVWVWLAVDERPRAATLAGGGLVLLAVVAQVLLGGRPRRPPAPLD